LEQVIKLGERALNVIFPDRMRLVELAQGSFQLVQLLCHKVCVLDGVDRTLSETRELQTSINVVIERVMEELALLFKEATIQFARGSRLRREGRAPYLHILKWLSESNDWSLNLESAMTEHDVMKQSIRQLIDNKWLHNLLFSSEKSELLSQYFHFEKNTNILSVEDPKLMFYLKNLVWQNFTREVGYKLHLFRGRYDVALSFAGADREIAEKIFLGLSQREISVFYDFNEQSSILGLLVEDYLAPIYRSESRYIIALLSKNYPTKFWTKFESDNFKGRFGEHAVIPIRFSDVSSGFFEDHSRYGGLYFDREGDNDASIKSIVDHVAKKLQEDNRTSAS